MVRRWMATKMVRQAVISCSRRRWIAGRWQSALIFKRPAIQATSSEDNLTNDTTPTFDVTVAEPGWIKLYIDGSHYADVADTALAEPGTYSFTSPAITDGIYKANVIFIPATGARQVRALPFTVETESFQILGALPYGSGHSSIDHFDLTVTEPLDEATLRASARILTPSGGEVTISNVVDLGDNQYRLEFPVQNLDGVYQLQVDPSATDLAGNLLDQDLDEVAGEDPDDQFMYSLPVHKVGQNLLVNGSFETGIWPDIPTVTGRWSGDRAFSSTVDSRGMVAPEGDRALRFYYTTPTAAGEGSITSDVYQLIDLGIYESDIAAGRAVVWASALFNRVHNWNGETDTQFEFSMAAYSGELATFPDQIDNGELDEIEVVLFSDPNVDTWEQTDGWMVLPPGVDFLAIRVTAVEDVYDDIDVTEFHGHFVDAAHAVVIVPPDKPLVTGYQPTGTQDEPVSHFEVTFSEEINSASFTAADVVLLDPDGQPVTIEDSPVHLGNNEWQVSFDPQIREGEYQLLVGPHIEDLDGHELDLDIDGLPGEDPDDVYVGTFSIDLPFDLAVSEITAPAQTIADPAQVTIGYEVTNVGPKPTVHGTWTDIVVLSEDQSIGYGDFELMRVEHQGVLAAGESYEYSETIDLPPGFTGRYHLLVHADVDGVLSEFEPVENNLGEFAEFFDVMPIPYADLQVESVDFVDPAMSGQPLAITWTVSNQGIGITNRGLWRDSIFLYTGDQGEQHVTNWWFTHLGQVPVGGSYTHTQTVTLPDGLDGIYYLRVTAANADGPFEFAFRDNNTTNRLPLEVQLSSSPDLQVTDIVAPESVEEGTLIDVSWTVANEGAGVAEGSWVDRVVMQDAHNASAPLLRLGDFHYSQPLAAGLQYTRHEQVRVPNRVADDFRIIVTTDVGNDVYEHERHGQQQTG